MFSNSQKMSQLEAMDNPLLKLKRRLEEYYGGGGKEKENLDDLVISSEPKRVKQGKLFGNKLDESSSSSSSSDSDDEEPKPTSKIVPSSDNEKSKPNGRKLFNKSNKSSDEDSSSDEETSPIINKQNITNKKPSETRRLLLEDDLDQEPISKEASPIVEQVKQTTKLFARKSTNDESSSSSESDTPKKNDKLFGKKETLSKTLQQPEAKKLFGKKASSDSSSSDDSSDDETPVKKSVPSSGKLFGRKADDSSSGSESDEEIERQLVQAGSKQLFKKNAKIDEKLLKGVKTARKSNKAFLETISSNHTQQVYLINSATIEQDEEQKRSGFEHVLTLSSLKESDTPNWFDFLPLTPYYYLSLNHISSMGMFKVTDDTKSITYHLNLNGILANFEGLEGKHKAAYKYHGSFKQTEQKTSVHSITLCVRLEFISQSGRIIMQVQPYHSLSVANLQLSNNGGRILPTNTSASFSRSIHPSQYQAYLKRGRVYGVRVRMMVVCKDLQDGEDVKNASMSLSWNEDSDLSLLVMN